MGVLTVYALFGDDVRLMSDVSADAPSKHPAGAPTDIVPAFDAAPPCHVHSSCASSCRSQTSHNASIHRSQIHFYRADHRPGGYRRSVSRAVFARFFCVHYRVFDELLRQAWIPWHHRHSNPGCEQQKIQLFGRELLFLAGHYCHGPYHPLLRPPRGAARRRRSTHSRALACVAHVVLVCTKLLTLTLVLALTQFPRPRSSRS